MNPKQSLEQAAYNFLRSKTLLTVPRAQIYKGVENAIDIVNGDEAEPQTRIMPAVTVACDSDHTQIGFKTRNFRGPLSVKVEASAHETTDAVFDATCREIFEHFNVSDLADQLSASLDEFTCTFANLTDTGNAIRNGSNWECTIRIDCVHAQANL